MDERAITPIQLPDGPDLPYPDDGASFLRKKGFEVLIVPALQTALELGNKRCANVVLLGALSGRLILKKKSWDAAITRRFPAKILDLNRRAFDAGRTLGRRLLPRAV